MEWQPQIHRAVLLRNEEDRFTEFLAQLLQAPAVRRVFVNELCHKEGVGPILNEICCDHLKVYTQVQIEGGRPDLVIKDEKGDKVFLLFEAKVGSWLHEDQLVPYAREVEIWKQDNPGGVARLYIIAPKGNSENQCSEGEKQIRDAGIESVTPVAIAWEDISDKFRGLSESVKGIKLKVFMETFVELVRWRFGEWCRKFTNEEVQFLADPLVPPIFARLSSIVHRIRKELLKLDDFRSSCIISPGGGEGYYLSFEGKKWWFGLWFDGWRTVRDSPLIFQLLGFEDRLPLRLPEVRPCPVQYTAWNNTKGYAVPLPLREDVEIDVLVKEHADIIRRYCKECPGSGAPA